MLIADPKNFLWNNIERLMGGGFVSVDAVQRKTKVGRGTIQRIKQGETSVGTDTLVSIAQAFGVEAWQLLVPNPDEVAGATPVTLSRALGVIAELLQQADKPTRDLAAGMLENMARNPENHGRVALGMAAMLGIDLMPAQQARQ